MFGLWEKISDFCASLSLGANNGVINVSSDGPGSLEIRLAAKGNTGTKFWRVLFNATGGLECQVAQNEDFTDARNVLSFNPNANSVNWNLDAYGINADSENPGSAASITFRTGDGGGTRTPVTMGQISFGSSPLNPNANAMVLSSIGLSGSLQPCIMIDPNVSTPEDSGANPVCLWVDGAWRRVRRDPLNGYATIV